ncbi:SCO-spondin-like isoform X2 [Saccostrea cucullata]|uniref:SCO-spondin-like isoform X2 n=1 Tax=Saccostrea cuccullata TaxID=36930 RepID=UPI002ECFF8E6
MWYLVVTLLLGSTVTVLGQRQQTSCYLILCSPDERCVDGLCQPITGHRECSFIPYRPCPKPGDYCQNGKCIPGHRECSFIPYKPCPNLGDYCRFGKCIPGPRECSFIPYKPCPNLGDFCRFGKCYPGPYYGSFF